MTIKQAIKILITANKWRRGAEVEMPDPREYGVAVDIAIEVMEQFLKDTPAMKGRHVELNRYE